MRRIERREWLLWSSAILVTLLLTLGILSFSFPMLREYAYEASNWNPCEKRLSARTSKPL